MHSHECQVSDTTGCDISFVNGNRCRDCSDPYQFDADGGFAGVGRYGWDRNEKPLELVMAPRSGAGLRAAKTRSVGAARSAAPECAGKSPPPMPEERARRALQWARLDSNQGPTDYESAALTS